MVEEEKMWYAIFNEEITFALGKKRDQGYWWFPKLGYSIHESNMFESNVDAEMELLKRLMIKDAELKLKINKLKKKLEG